MRKLILITFSFLFISCATFRHNVIPVQEQITTLLESISTDADRAVNAGIMTKVQRQDFAKNVMLPSINGATKINDCLLSGSCVGITATLTNLSSTLLVGINNYIALLPNSDIKTSLIARLNSVIQFVTGLYGKIKGTPNPLVDSSYVYSFSQ